MTESLTEVRDKGGCLPILGNLTKRANALGVFYTKRAECFLSRMQDMVQYSL